ncbi:hypothetical protein ACO0LC_22515 [Undibacterium sp. JH2W]|uniref:hypothetical protein n=1 Tax=Undibacterium sp. JH2W TaxID=3413037 RepID=UPI003BF1CFC4
MNEAIVVFTRNGLFAATVAAHDVHSHEHARKLWPLVTATTPRQLVTWVKPSFENGKCTRRPHFRTLPGTKNLSVGQIFDQEEAVRFKATQESQEHAQAKYMVAEALRTRLAGGKAMPWYFKDEESSQYHLQGNLLMGAAAVHVEEPVETSFGCKYRLDVAISSKPINTKPILLGGVEIEWGHQFDGRKALIGKSQAFPLISIDISGMTLDEITPEWADMALTATTHSSNSGQRKTYVYLHDVLYPLYVQIPSGLINEDRHQFLVFAPDVELSQLERWTRQLQGLVGLRSGVMAVSIINAKSEQSRTMLNNAGEVVGIDWQQVNAQRCLMLTVQRPTAVDVSSHLFHLCMANLFLSHTDSLVGYKYMTGILNEDPQQDVWHHSKWNPETKRFDYYRILPKRLSEPRSRIINVLNDLGQSAN